MLVYAYSLLDPETGKRIKWGYIGKTTQALEARHNQHMKLQPWSDLYPQVRVVATFKSEALMNLAELILIKIFRPYYNAEHNYNNKRRIPRHKAKRDRLLRDMQGEK